MPMTGTPKRRLQRSVQLTPAMWRWVDARVRERQRRDGARYASSGAIIRELVEQAMAAEAR